MHGICGCAENYTCPQVAIPAFPLYFLERVTVSKSQECVTGFEVNTACIESLFQDTHPKKLKSQEVVKVFYDDVFLNI